MKYSKVFVVSLEGPRLDAFVPEEVDESSSSVVANDGGGILGDATGERSAGWVKIRRHDRRIIASEASLGLPLGLLLVTEGEDCG